MMVGNNIQGAKAPSSPELGSNFLSKEILLWYFRDDEPIDAMIEEIDYHLYRISLVLQTNTGTHTRSMTVSHRAVNYMYQSYLFYHPTNISV